MVSQHGIGLWTQITWFKVVLAQPTLGMTRVFEGERIDQAFPTLACKVNAIFFLHTRGEGIGVDAIGFGEIKHTHLLLDKPSFLSRGKSAP